MRKQLATLKPTSRRRSHRAAFRANPYDIANLNGRVSTYYTDHQGALYASLLSVALGIGGLSAATLLTSAHGPRILLVGWMFWSVAFLSVVVVYSGVTVSAFLLPTRIPNVFDIALPFFTTMTQFLLFFLVSPLVKAGSARIFEARLFFCFALFALLASACVWRARWVFSSARVEMGPVITNHRDRLFTDGWVSAIAAAISSIFGVFAVAGSDEVAKVSAIVGAGMLILFMLSGLVNQRANSQAVEDGILRDPLLLRPLPTGNALRQVTQTSGHGLSSAR